MDKRFDTDEEAFTAVTMNGRDLQYVPFDCRSPELCQAAVEQSGSALEFVPHVLKDEDLCLLAVQLNGYSLMWVPDQLRTIAVCQAAVKNDEDAKKYVPDWILTGMEGHLLTVHCDCDCEAWKVEVTNMSGTSLVEVMTNPKEVLSGLIQQLEAELDNVGSYEFQKVFMFPDGRRLTDWPSATPLGHVMPMGQSEFADGVPSGFLL